MLYSPYGGNIDSQAGLATSRKQPVYRQYNNIYCYMVYQCKCSEGLEIIRVWCNLITYCRLPLLGHSAIAVCPSWSRVCPEGSWAWLSWGLLLAGSHSNPSCKPTHSLPGFHFRACLEMFVEGFQSVNFRNKFWCKG